MKIRDMFNIFFLKFNFVFCFSFITLSCVSGMSTKVCLFVWLVDLATECYEHACGKFPNKMELMMGLFNCYVREYSFVKQQQVCCFLLSRGLIFCLFNLSHFFFYMFVIFCFLICRQLLKCTSSLVKKNIFFGLFVASTYRFSPLVFPLYLIQRVLKCLFLVTWVSLRGVESELKEKCHHIVDRCKKVEYIRTLWTLLRIS